MDPRGKRILIIGDSLSASATSPGGFLAAELRARGAASVTVDARVSRSAVNLWNGTNGEVGASVVAAATQRPDTVIVFLGTNDAASGVRPAVDEAGFRRIVALVPKAELWAIGPPSFARADLQAKTDAVYATLRKVFGPAQVLDLRPLTADVLTTAQGRAGDGVHFAATGAAKVATRIAQALLAMPGPTALGPVAVDGGQNATPLSPVHRATATWPILFGGFGAAAALIASAVVLRRRRSRGLRGALSAPTLRDREHVPAVVRGEIDEALDRAARAGADGEVEYVGAGATGIVFCDTRGRAYKVGRQKISLEPEAAFLRTANQVPTIRRNVATFIAYDADNRVIVRECVKQKGVRQGGRTRIDGAKAFALAAQIREVMLPYGFTAPERKEDSFVYVSGRGPVLVDAGGAYRFGSALVRHALDVLNGRTQLGPHDRVIDIVNDVAYERDQGRIPAKTASKLIARLHAHAQPHGLGTSTARVHQVAEAVRSEMRRCGYGGGRCADASREIVRRLTEEGIPARVVHGEFSVTPTHRSPHHWVEVGDVIVDATIDQFQIGFDEPLPEVLVAPRASWPQYHGLGAPATLTPSTMKAVAIGLHNAGWELLQADVDVDQKTARVSVKREDGLVVIFDVDRLGRASITRELRERVAVPVGRRGDRFMSEQIETRFVGREKFAAGPGNVRAALRWFANYLGDNGTQNRLAARDAIQLLLSSGNTDLGSTVSASRRFRLGDLPRDMREELFNEHATLVNPEATERGFYSKFVPQGVLDITDVQVDRYPPDQLESYVRTDMSEFPPIVIADGKLMDGGHRISAARMKGISQLPYIDVTGLIDTKHTGFISELPVSAVLRG